MVVLLACAPSTPSGAGSSESTGDETSNTSSTTASTTTSASLDTSSEASSSTQTTSTDTGSSETGATETTTASTYDESSSSESGGAVDLGEWSKRRAVLIDNPNDAPLDDHEIALFLDWDEDMNADLSDLRFTDDTVTEVLPHWLEDSVAPVSFVVWVRVPHVPANDVGAIYMYYGNAAASDVSDPAATFHFWDDFDGNDIDATWAADGDYEVAGGTLTVSSGSVYSVAPVTEAPGWVLEARMRWPNTDTNENQTGLTLGNFQGSSPGITHVGMHVGVGQPLGVDASIDGVSVFGQNNVFPALDLMQFGWLRVGTGPDTARFGWTHNAPTQLWDIDHHGDEFDDDLYVWLGGANGHGIGASDPVYDVEYDTVLVRRFELSPPEGALGVEEDN